MFVKFWSLNDHKKTGIHKPITYLQIMRKALMYRILTWVCVYKPVQSQPLFVLLGAVGGFRPLRPIELFYALPASRGETKISERLGKCQWCRFSDCRTMGDWYIQCRSSLNVATMHWIAARVLLQHDYCKNKWHMIVEIGVFPIILSVRMQLRLKLITRSLNLENWFCLSYINEHTMQNLDPVHTFTYENITAKKGWKSWLRW